MSKGGGCPEKQCPQGYKSAADKTYIAGGYGFLSKRPCLHRPNTRIPAATEARTNTACTLRHRRNVVPIPSVFADNPLSRPHAICRGWWRQVNSPILKCAGMSIRRFSSFHIDRPLVGRETDPRRFFTVSSCFPRRTARLTTRPLALAASSSVQPRSDFATTI